MERMTTEEAADQVQRFLDFDAFAGAGDKPSKTFEAMRIVMADYDRIRADLAAARKVDPVSPTERSDNAEAAVLALQGQLTAALSRAERAERERDIATNDLSIVCDRVLSLNGQLVAAQARLNDIRAETLKVPEVWTLEERDGIAGAFSEANQKHGHYESLFAAVAWFLRHRLRALRSKDVSEARETDNV